jgi:uncharacterized membrane protein YbhN (UPF0104 family)
LRSSYYVQKELMALTLGENASLTEESITTSLQRVSAEIRKEESALLHDSEVSRLEAEAKLVTQVEKTDLIKTAVYWRCDKRATREATGLSLVIWCAQFAVAAFGAVKFSENSKFGLIVLFIAFISGAVRLAGTRWDLKPLKAGPAFKK